MTYKGSDEEKDDILNAYRKFKGKMDKMYETIMLSNPLDDEDRFRVIIDEAIKNGEVEAHKLYTEETEVSKKRRMEKARREAAEAEEEAKKMGISDKLSGKEKNRKKVSSEDSLAALIRSRNAGASSFIDKLEAKYTALENKSKKKGKKGKSSAPDEDIPEMPTEEDFQAAAMRLKRDMGDGEVAGSRKSKRTKR